MIRKLLNIMQRQCVSMCRLPIAITIASGNRRRSHSPWRLGIGNMSDEPSSRAAQVLEGEAQMVNPEMLALGLVHESQFRCMYCGADPEKDADPVTARHFEIQLDLVLWSLVGYRIGFLLECWSRPTAVHYRGSRCTYQLLVLGL